jgi:hypothetical protein
MVKFFTALVKKIARFLHFETVREIDDERNYIYSYIRYYDNKALLKPAWKDAHADGQYSYTQKNNLLFLTEKITD